MQRKRGGQRNNLARQWLGAARRLPGDIVARALSPVAEGVDALENLREYYRPGGVRSRGGYIQQPGKSYGRERNMERQQGVGQRVQFQPDSHRNMSSDQIHDDVRAKLDHIQDGGNLSPKHWMSVLHHLSQDDNGRLAHFSDLNFQPDEWDKPIGMAEMRQHLGNNVRAHHGQRGGEGAAALRYITDRLHDSHENGSYIDLKRATSQRPQEAGLAGSQERPASNVWDDSKMDARPFDWREPNPRRPRGETPKRPSPWERQQAEAQNKARAARRANPRQRRRFRGRPQAARPTPAARNTDTPMYYSVAKAFGL